MPAAGQNGVGAVDARAPQAVAGAAEEALVAGAPAREAVAEAAVRALFILRGAADAPGAARAKSAVGEDGNGARAGGRAKGRVDEARHDGDEARHVGVLREERDGDGVCVAARGDAGARARRKRHGHVGERRERIERGLDLRGRRSVGQRRRGPLAEGEAERPRVGEALEELDLVALAARAGVVAARAGPERAVVPRPAGVAVAAEDAVGVPRVSVVGKGVSVDERRRDLIRFHVLPELPHARARPSPVALVLAKGPAGHPFARGPGEWPRAVAGADDFVASALARTFFKAVVRKLVRARVGKPRLCARADSLSAVAARVAARAGAGEGRGRVPRRLWGGRRRGRRGVVFDDGLAASAEAVAVALCFPGTRRDIR
mmetsp:Transcript_7318/g.25660  ORF Transcript_7318/g.25660 Transcript_7318/m.25660 type:complete len:375 (-) Transcript_7318:854-1978(-)